MRVAVSTMMLSEVSSISLPPRYCPPLMIVEQARGDGKRQQRYNSCARMVTLRQADVYRDEPLQGRSRIAGGVRAGMDDARHASARRPWLYRISPATRPRPGGSHA